MKLHLQANASNAVTSYGDTYIELNRVRHDCAVWFASEGEVAHWPVMSPSGLTIADFQIMLESRPQMVLLGTGASQHFPPPTLLAALSGLGVGLEAMNTAAACRTFNVLVSEGRQVVAALFLPGFVSA